MRLRRELALFAIGGVIGLLVDAAIVQGLVRGAQWNPYVARVLSFLVAASITWWWNRSVTFVRRRRHRSGPEWLRWMGVMSVGAALNYGIYALLVALLPLVREWPALGVAAGSASAAAINFLGARTVVFNGAETRA